MRSGWAGAGLACVGLILLAAFTGGADAADPWNIQDNVAVAPSPLDASHTVGQTFVFHYTHLHALEVRWIVSPDFEYAGTGRVVLHLRRRPADSVDLAAVSLGLNEIHNNDLAKFTFPAIADSQDQPFYFLLEASPAQVTRGYVSVWASAGDDYPDGQMYVDGIAASGDLAFRAYYEPDLPFVLSALPGAAARYLFPGLVALLLFIIPGRALFIILGDLAAQSPIERLGLAIGAGLATLSFGSILLLSFGAPVGWLGFGAAAALVVFAGSAWRTSRLPRQAPAARAVPRSNIILWSLGALALLSVAVVFLQIRDTPVPLWKDSPVHAGIIGGILSQGHLPTDVFYHFGSQSIIALLVNLSGAAIPLVMLLVGQLLIVQIGLSVFLLSKRLTGSDVAGLVSVVCVWFVSPTPAYFTTWGRYPLLLGAALLPLALLVGIEFVDRPHFDGRACLLVIITFWGMAFAHVRLTLFYLIFAAVYLTYRIWRRRGRRARVSLAARSAIALLAGAPFGLLWLGAINTGVPTSYVLTQNVADYSLDLLTAISISLAHHGPALLTLAAIGVILALFRRSRAVRILLAWFGALAALSALPVVGEKYLPPAMVVLMGFVPASIIVGDLIDWVYRKTAARSSQAAVVWGVTLWIVSALGARDMLSVVNPATILFSGADANAMTWIKERTPADSRFLINSELWYSSSFSPSDGGWWIPLLTGRSNDYVDSPTVTESADMETLTRWIDSHQIDLIYLGRRGGVLQRNDFICQPERYTRVYAQDGITIYRVERAALKGLAPRAGCADHLP